MDIVRPIAWREPPRRSIVVPYAMLLMAALLCLWFPLWRIEWSAWLALGLLFVTHTTMNLASHYTARRDLARAH